ncbi:MAG: four helix bundle protein [bacterium]
MFESTRCYASRKIFKKLSWQTIFKKSPQILFNRVNIVEGWKRPTTREYLNFLGYSQASLAELIDNTEDCFRHEIISQADYEEYYGWLKKSDYLLGRLVKSLEEKMESQKTIPYQEKCRQILLEERRKNEEGRKLFGFDKIEQEIIEKARQREMEREKIKG